MAFRRWSRSGTAPIGATCPLRRTWRAGKRHGDRLHPLRQRPLVRVRHGRFAPGPQRHLRRPRARGPGDARRVRGSDRAGRPERAKRLQRCPALHLALDNVPLFLRGMYNSYATEVDPKLGYVFWEMQEWKFPRVPAGAKDKPFEEAAFLERVRAMLVMEDAEVLWPARATPRAWLQQGKKIAVTAGHLLRHRGLRNHLRRGPRPHHRHRRDAFPPAAPLRADRLRHPKALPIRSVTVNGKPWTAFSPDKETIELRGLAGKNHGRGRLLTNCSTLARNASEGRSPAVPR